MYQAQKTQSLNVTRLVSKGPRVQAQRVSVPMHLTYLGPPRKMPRSPEDEPSETATVCEGMRCLHVDALASFMEAFAKRESLKLSEPFYLCQLFCMAE